MFRFATLMAAGLLASAGAASADDLIRLDGRGDDALVQEAGYRGGYYGGYRGHYGGYGGYRGNYGGYRGWGGYYGGYRPGISFGFYAGRPNYGWGGYRGGWGGYYGGYRGYYGGWGGYRPYAYYRPSYGYGVSYGYSPVYYSSSYYLSPCSADVTTVPEVSTLVLRSPFEASPASAPSYGSAPASDGTYLYDGGPRSFIPMPSDTAPSANPERRSLPRDGRIVSLTPAPSNHRYLAYGETPASAPRPTREPASDVIRASLPTLGEAGDSFSGGTMIYTAALR